MYIGHLWNDNDEWKFKVLEKITFQCRLVNHKAHMDWNSDLTRASAVRVRWLTLRTMALPRYTSHNMWIIGLMSIFTKLLLGCPYLFYQLFDINQTTAGKTAKEHLHDLYCLWNKKCDGTTSTLLGEGKGANKVWRGSRKKPYSLEGLGIGGQIILKRNLN